MNREILRGGFVLDARPAIVNPQIALPRGSNVTYHALRGSYPPECLSTLLFATMSDGIESMQEVLLDSEGKVALCASWGTGFIEKRFLPVRFNLQSGIVKLLDLLPAFGIHGCAPRCSASISQAFA